VLRHLGVQVVIAESFARIHVANLVNFGIVPLLFADPRDRELLEVGDTLSLGGIDAARAAGAPIKLDVARLPDPVLLRHELSSRQLEILEAGGLLNLARRAQRPMAEAMA